MSTLMVLLLNYQLFILKDEIISVKCRRGNANSNVFSKMQMLRTARSLVKHIEMPSSLQLPIEGQLVCLLPFQKCSVLRGYNERWHRQTVPSGLQMTLPSLWGTEKNGMPGSPNFILILKVTQMAMCATTWYHLEEMNRATDPRSKGLEFNSQSWACIDVFGKFPIPCCLYLPNSDGYWLLESLPANLHCICILFSLWRWTCSSICSYTREGSEPMVNQVWIETSDPELCIFTSAPANDTPTNLYIHGLHRFNIIHSLLSICRRSTIDVFTFFKNLLNDG